MVFSRILQSNYGTGTSFQYKFIHDQSYKNVDHNNARDQAMSKGGDFLMVFGSS